MSVNPAKLLALVQVADIANGIISRYLRQPDSMTDDEVEAETKRVRQKLDDAFAVWEAAKARAADRAGGEG